MEKGWCTFQTEEYCGICKSESDSDQQSVVKNGMELNQHPPNRFGFLKNSLILDTGSTISAAVMNENMVININKAKVPIVMTTNAGTKTLNTKAEIPNFGKAMLDASNR